MTLLKSIAKKSKQGQKKKDPMRYQIDHDAKHKIPFDI